MPTDPLRSVQGQERLLFDIWRREAVGKDADAVMGACLNIFMNAIRQNYATRQAAEQKMSEMFGRAAQMLLANCYDSVTGKRRTLVPHTQVIRMAYHMEDDFPQQPR